MKLTSIIGGVRFHQSEASVGASGQRISGSRFSDLNRNGVGMDAGRTI